MPNHKLIMLSRHKMRPNIHTIPSSALSASRSRLQKNRQRRKIPETNEGGNWKFYIIDLAGQLQPNTTQPSISIAQRTFTTPHVKYARFLYFSFSVCLLFILFLCCRAAANFHVRIYLFNFERFVRRAWGMENIRLNRENNWKNFFELDTRVGEKAGPVEKMENPIFFIVLERWTFSERYTRFEAVKGKKCVWIYAKHRQTINIWTRIPGVGWDEVEREAKWIDLAYMKEMVRWQFTWKKTADVKNSAILARIFA